MRGVLHSILLDLDSIIVESRELMEEKLSVWGRK
jgi:hypothetical protein